MIYSIEGNRAAGNRTLKLESTGFSHGRIIASETSNGTVYTPHMHATDHLGNVRMVYTVSSIFNFDVVAKNDYYPFGLRHENSDSAAGSETTNRHLFNGKEEQTVLGLDLLDYGARNYDPEIVRWLAIDLLSEKHYSTSPYVYALNNPIKYIDIFGLDTWEVDQFGKVKNVDKEGGEQTQTIYALNADGTRKDAPLIVYGNEYYRIMRNLEGTLSNLGYSYSHGSAFALGTLFLFFCDNTNVEWRLSRFREEGTPWDKYALGTVHEESLAIRPEHMNFSRSDEIASIHSHPSKYSKVDGRGGELGSMGWVEYGFLWTDSDSWHAFEQRNGDGTYQNPQIYVYFPNDSKNLYHVRGAEQPALMNSLKGHNYNPQSLFSRMLNEK